MEDKLVTLAILTYQYPQLELHYNVVKEDNILSNS